MLKTFSNCTVEPVPSTLRKYLVDFRLIVWRFTPLVPGITKYIQRYFWILHSPAHFFSKKLPFGQNHLSSFLLKFKRVWPPPPLLTNQFLTPPPLVWHYLIFLADIIDFSMFHSSHIFNVENVATILLWSTLKPCFLP